MVYPSNVPDDMEEMEALVLADKAAEKPEATFENIIVFAKRHKEIVDELETIAEYVKTLTAEAKDIEEIKLPSVFNALDMKDFGLKDGRKIKIEPAFQGSIVVEDPEQRKAQLDWLSGAGGRDLIKNKISLEFTKGQDTEAKALVDMLSEYGFTYNMAESVHASSLGSFIKEKMEKGETVPLEALKWRYYFKANIKPPPKKKKSKED